MTKGDILFLDNNHIYFDNVGKLESCSGFTKQYFPQFDEVFNSQRMMANKLFPELEKKAKEKFKWYQPEYLQFFIDRITKDDFEDLIFCSEVLQKEWKDEGIESAEYGTHVHDYCETSIAQHEYIKSPFDHCYYKVMARPRGKGYDNKYILKNLLKNKFNMYCQEVVVVDHKNRVAGQIDKLWLYWNGTHHIGIIGDYKSDKELTRNKWMHPNSFHAPFLDIGISKIEYYTFKMSYYKIMCELDGLPIKEMYLYHIPKKGNRRYIKIGDYSDKIKKRTLIS